MDEKTVRIMEARLFPEFAHSPNYVADGFMYSAPSYHFASGLITEEMIDDLKQGGNLLSVGAGKAHLELFLVQALDIPAVSITAADVALLDGLPFATRQFDMYDAWPQLGQFDYVIFPKSVFLRGPQKRATPEADLIHLLQQSYDALTPAGQVRMTGYLPPSNSLRMVKGLVEECQNVHLRYHNGKLHDFLQMNKD
jgi:hypothetical protein